MTNTAPTQAVQCFLVNAKRCLDLAVFVKSVVLMPSPKNTQSNTPAERFLVWFQSCRSSWCEVARGWEIDLGACACVLPIHTAMNEMCYNTNITLLQNSLVCPSHSLCVQNRVGNHSPSSQVTPVSYHENTSSYNVTSLLMTETIKVPFTIGQFTHSLAYSMFSMHCKCKVMPYVICFTFPH